MKGYRKRGKKNNMLAPANIQDEDKFMKLKGQLLPGIPNEVTLDKITTRLPWRTFDTLSSVSRAWQQALQDRLVHDARVCTHSTETVIVFNRTNAIVVYCRRDKTFYLLPPIPLVERGIPCNCRWVLLFGKIYVLGGTKGTCTQLARQEVYMLDVAGQWRWTECAPMREARAEFACGVLNGKIYVFGGASQNKLVGGSEVYDPSINAWSCIKTARCLQYDNDVAILGEELLFSGGVLCRNGYPAVASCLRAYHPVTGKWRVLSKDFMLDGARRRFSRGNLFVVQGKFYYMSLYHIRVYDIENNSWTVLHSCSFTAITERVRWLRAVLAVDNELLAIVSVETFDKKSFALLVHSRGFGSEVKMIVWEKLPCSPFSEVWRPFMRLLDL